MSAGISENAIAAEMQYHPAASQDAAWTQAEFALHLREALLREACRLGLRFTPDPTDALIETEEENLIRQVFDHEVRVEDISDLACEDEYARHAGAFCTPPLFEAAHILIAADMSRAGARAAARQEAQRLGTILAAAPKEFADLARAYSACPSAAHGGALGQITPRDVTPELATMLREMTPGTICPVPVPSRHGYHLLRLDQRVEGQPLPFSAVREQIRERLRQRAWTAAAGAYARQLVNAGISIKPE